MPDNYQPYTEEPESYAPGSIAAAEHGETGERYAPGSMAESQHLAVQRQQQLDDDEQMEAAIAMGMLRQKDLRRIQAKIGSLEAELKILETDLTNFRNSTSFKFLTIFQPKITLLVDLLIEQLKKQAEKANDEAAVALYTGFIDTATALIAGLKGLKLFAAFLDAAFISPYSAAKLIVETLATIVIPIIILIISPIYILFLATMFMIGSIPLLKGKLTNNIKEVIEKVTKQRDIWQAKLDRAKRKVTLRKQIKSLKNVEKQAGSQRKISLRS